MSRSNRQPEELLERLEWTVIRRLDGLLQGDYRTLFRGFGVDLADLREYQPGDDVRFIDWNVTARVQTPHVREYNEDREITAWFLLDLSPSVDFGSASVRKREKLIELVTVLVRLLTRHGNRVGAMFYGGGVDKVVPARGGRTHVLHLLDTLLRMPELTSARPTALADLFVAANRLITRRSLIFTVTDFHTESGWERPLGHLARRNEVLAVRLFDPLEVEIPDIGMVLMSDSETGEQALVDTHDRGFRKRYAEEVERHDEAIRQSLKRTEVDGLEVSTSDDLVEAILRFAMLRKGRSVASGAGGIA